MIHMQLPFLSPSINHVYMHVRAGKFIKRTLTPEGKAFKAESTALLASKYPTLLTQMKKNKPYALFFRFTVTDLINKGWANGKTARYKQHDVSNRIKVLEDVVVDVCGVDDSHFTMVACQKVQGEKEQTDIYIWSPEEESSPFDVTALSVR